MDLSAKKQQLGEKLQRILTDAEEAGRPLTDAELREFDATHAELERIDRTAGAAAKMDALRQPRPRVTTPDQPYRSDGPRSSPAPWPPSPTGWIDATTGRPLRAYRRDEPMADPRAGLSVGRYLRGVLTGDWRGAEQEQALVRNSMSTTGAGHVLVPDVLSRQVLDLARARSVLVQAGVPSVEMTSDVLNIAQLLSDPTMTVKSENAAFTPQEMVFGAGTMVARTAGCVISASREIAADAPNFPQLVEGVLGRALATEIDRLCLAGEGGSDGVLGLLHSTQILETDTIGAIDWLDLHDAVGKVRELNHEPSHYVVHPTIAGDLDAIVTGNYTASARTWLGSPPSLEGVTRLTSTSCPLANAITGDFAEGAVMGWRSPVMVETTMSGGDAFLKHQLLVKVTARFGFLTVRGAAFHRLAGITS